MTFLNINTDSVKKRLKEFQYAKIKLWVVEEIK
jgi:hypothetical protein